MTSSSALFAEDDRLRGARAALSRAALPVLVVAACCIDFVPFMPNFPVNQLDSAWKFALNTATASGLDYGRDILYTLGPYAFLYSQQYNPATDGLMMWGSLLLAISLAASLLCLTRGSGRWTALGFAICLACLQTDAQFLAIPFIGLALVDRATRAGAKPAPAVTVTLILLVLALALFPLVKGTFAVAAAIAMAAASLLLAMRGRPKAALAGLLIFAGAMAVFWVAAGQALAWLPGYFVARGPVVGGYAAAMATPCPAWLILLFWGACLALAAPYARFLRADGKAGLAVFFASSLLVFLAFKEGFIRADFGHVPAAAGMLVVIAGRTALTREGFMPRAGLAAAIACCATMNCQAIGVTTAIAYHVKPGVIAEALGNSLAAPFLNAETGLRTRLTEPGALQRQFAESLRRIRAEQDLPNLSGPTDIYSCGQSILLAYGFDWDPRPALQSFTAYTPALARLDLAHLTGAAAPANILFAVEPIDSRLPSLEDGASWPVLLSRYDITGLYGDLAVLRRRPGGEAIETPLAAGSVRLGEPFALPDSKIIWAKIAIRPTWLGRLVALLYKPPRLLISYGFPDQHVETYRYIEGMGETGFVAAPVVRSTVGFIDLQSGDVDRYLSRRQPSWMVITAEYGAGWLWRSAYSVELYSLKLSG